MNFAEAIASNLPLLLESEIPRRVLDKTRDVWLRLYLTSPMRYEQQAKCSRII